MTDYEKAMGVFKGTFHYSFDFDSELTLTGVDNDNEMFLDFAYMTKDTFHALSDGGVGYDDAMHILTEAQKKASFDGTRLTVQDEWTRKHTTLDLGRLTEKMYYELLCESLCNVLGDLINGLDESPEGISI